jgi:hypothetical protein
MSKRPSLPSCPDGAIGILTVRHDRPERFAIYRPDGTLGCSFACDQTPNEIREAIGATLQALPPDTRDDDMDRCAQWFTYIAPQNCPAWAVFTPKGAA